MSEEELREETWRDRLFVGLVAAVIAVVALWIVSLSFGWVPDWQTTAWVAGLVFLLFAFLGREWTTILDGGLHHLR